MKANSGSLPITRLLTASVLVVLAVVGSGAWYEYHRIRDAALQRIVATAFLMEEHVIGTLGAADQVLLRAIDLMNGADPDSLRGDEPLWQRLHSIAGQQPMLVMLRLLNADGTTVFETTSFPAQPINLAEGGYFREPRDGAVLHVGAAVMDPTVHKPVFILARRLEGRDGQFRGVILAALDASHFNHVYRKIDQEPLSATGLIRLEDGAFLAREPEGPQFVGKAIGPWSDFVAQQTAIGPGLFMGTSPIDQRWRYYAYRQVEGYPLVVFAGESIRNVVHLWLLHVGSLAGGSLLGIAGILYFGRSARRGARKLAEVNASLRQALVDKDMLFREVHHRVKNNLQVVSNLLLLQTQRIDDPTAKAAFRETMDRVHSVSAVHQVLYRSNQAVEIDLASHLPDLCAALAETYGARERGITVQVDAKHCRVHIEQAVPLALIVNEAVTNSFKYAFPDGGGVLNVTLDCSERELNLVVSDTGVGLPENATGGDSLGMSLISALTEQLEGRHVWHPGRGARLEVSVPRRGSLCTDGKH